MNFYLCVKGRFWPLTYQLFLIMKLAMLFTVIATTQVWAVTYAQRVTLNATDISLASAVEQVKTQTGYDFFLKGKHIANERVSVDIKEADLRTAMDLLLEGLPLSWVLEDETIIIQSNRSLDSRASAGGVQQPGRLVGKVSGSDGRPLHGATVTVPELNRSVMTDENGDYGLDVRPGTYSLEVSYLSYSKVRLGGISVREGERVTRDVTLLPVADELEEVVVTTALGLRRQAKSLGYSVGEVKGSDMARVPQENAVNGLTGRVTGLRVINTTSELNSDPIVLIRGYTSLSGNNSPLIVVNGVPTGTDVSVLSDLSADNIESVSVLKGPSAASLYGSRAGSGVLLVTTKRGSGRPGLGIDFNMGYTASIPYQFVPIQQRFVTGSNGGFDQTSNLWWGPEMGTSVVRFGTDGESTPLTPHPDNVRDFVEVGGSMLTSLGISHATDKLNLSLSLSDTRATGIYPGTNLSKDAVSIFAEYAISDRVKVSGNFNYLNSGSDNNRGLSYDNYPYEDLYFTPNWLDINELKDYWAEPGLRQSSWSSGFNNPWFTVHENINTFKKVRPYGNVKVDWEVAKGWNLMGRIGGFNESYTTENRMAMSEKGFPEGAYGYIGRELQQLNTDVLLNYKKELRQFSFDVSAGGNLFFQNNTFSNISGDRLELPGLYTASNIDRAAVSYSVLKSDKRIHSIYGMATVGFRDALFVELSGRNDWSSTLPEDNRSYFYPSVSLSAVLSDLIDMPEAVNLVKLRGGWAKVGKDTDPYTLSMTLTKSTWGGKTSYLLPEVLPTQNLVPESIISSEVGFDSDFFGNRLGLDVTYYQLEDRNQISRISVSGSTGYTATNVNAGIVKNEGLEVTLRGVPVRKDNLRWDVAFNFTKERSKLTALPEGVSNHQFWERASIFSQTTIGGTVGDLWGPDVLRVTEGPYAGWPLLNNNGYVQPGAGYIKLGNVNPDFTLGFQTNLSYKRFSVSASFDWRHGGDYYSESMKRLARDGRAESWYKGEGSSTFTGILNSHSFDNGSQLADEIRSNPRRYDGRDGLTWVGGRTAELGGFEYGNGDLANGAFFPGVIPDGAGGYIENFGDVGTRYFRSELIADPGAGYWSSGVQTWIYDASFLKLKEVSVAYRLPDRLAGRIAARGLSLSWYMRNLMIWTKAKNGIDPESTMLNRNSPFASDTNYQLGYDRTSFYPWTLTMGLKLSVQF